MGSVFPGVVDIGVYSRETNLGKSEEVRSMRRKGEMAYGFAQGKAEKQNFTHWKEGRGKEVGQRLFASRDITSSKIQDENFMHSASNSESFLLDTCVFEHQTLVSEKARERVVWNNLKKNPHKHKIRKEVILFFHRNLVKEKLCKCIFILCKF